jgi:uncharacterized protein (TIGR00288 family)
MNLSNTKIKTEKKDFYNICIGIDYPNMEIGLKKTDWPLMFDYEVIEEFALSRGEIVLSRIYGDWAYLQNSHQILSQFEVDLIDVPHVPLCGNKKKDTVDTAMAIDFGLMLHEYSEINLVIIVSGDSDFVPVIKKLKESKRMRVIVIGEKNSMSNSLGRIADETIFYQYIANLE